MKRWNLLGLLFLLTASMLSVACSKKGDIVAIPCTSRTTVAAFSLCIPDGFALAESTFGEKGSSILTFTNVGGDDPPLFIHIKHEPLLSGVPSSLEFAKRGRRVAAEQAPSYALISLSGITVSGSATLFHTFTAAPVEGEGSIAYYQVVLPASGEGYGFSATRQREPSDEDAKLSKTIFESIRFEEEV